MTDFLSWLEKFFGHTVSTGTEAIIIYGVQSGFVVLGGLWFAHNLRRSIVRHMRTGATDDAQQISYYQRLATVCVMVPAGLISIHILGLDLTPLFATGGIFALAFGFGMKTLAENFISGVIIRLEKIVVPGNVLELNGTIMTVDSVRLRSTKTHTYDGREIFTPNSKVLQSAVGTFTLDNRNYRVQTEFQVNSKVDQNRVREAIVQAVKKLDFHAAGTTPAIMLNAFDGHLVCYKVYTWVDDPKKSFAGLDALNKAVWQTLTESGIDFGN
jgi:potassium efflux system protein